jgi:translation initiation factor 1
MDICPKCGLPIQACVCSDIISENQQITVSSDRRKFGKVITLVSGLDAEGIKEIAKKLKNKLACGGTIKNSIIELQGDHKNRIKPALLEMGFNAGQINIQ